MRIVLLLTATLFFASTLRDIPDWAIGTWRGSLSWEHDTTDYAVSISISKDSVRWLSLATPNQQFNVLLDSVADNTCRFRLVSLSNTSSASLSSGTVELIHFPEWDDVLKIQFYPEESEEVWLGEVRRVGG